jgi:glycerophosphoryl diester phosphodiesterase
MFRLFYIPVFILCFTFCKKDDSIWQIENVNNNQISVFGHGGMGIHYREPMNSYESLSKCLSLGANGTEMDVSVTKDGVMVLYHNLKLDDATSCNGIIKDKTWDDIKDCKYKLPIFSKAKLIAASYFFDRVDDLHKYLFTFDCKVLEDDNEEYLNVFADALIQHIEKYNLFENCFIESFNITFLKILQQKNKKLHLFLYCSDYQTGLESSKLLYLYGLTMDMDKISSEEIKQAHQHGLHITLFNTKNEQDNLTAIKMSPDFIQTDKVDYLVNALKK